MHSHLIELMDPSRHVHPGIPYDFYSGYVVVESLNLDDGGQSRRQEETVVLGQLPQVVRAKLEEQWGKYQYVNDNKVVYVYVICNKLEIQNFNNTTLNFIGTSLVTDYHEAKCRQSIESSWSHGLSGHWDFVSR